MKSIKVENIAFTEGLIEQLQFMQEKEVHADMLKNAINLNGFIVEKMDFDEKENRNYICWLQFLNDVMKLLQLLEPSK